MIGRTSGRGQLLERRQVRRAAWQQRENDTRLRIQTGYVILDLLGRAPLLPSDEKEQLALKRIFAWKLFPVLKKEIRLL